MRTFKVYKYDFITRSYFGFGVYDVEKVHHFTGVINPMGAKYSSDIYSPLGASGVPLMGICHHGSAVKNIVDSGLIINF